MNLQGSSLVMPSVPIHILSQITSHFDSGNKIFWHTDQGHYSQPCWDPSAQAFSLACKEFRRLVMERRMRVMVVRAMDCWVDEAGWKLGSEIRASIKMIVLIRIFRNSDMQFLHTLPNLRTISNINLTNQHLFNFPIHRNPKTNPPTNQFPHITTLNAPQSDFVPLDSLQITLPLILRAFPNLKTLSFRPDIERHIATSSTASPAILDFGTLSHLRLDIRRLDPDGPRAVDADRDGNGTGIINGLGNGWDRKLDLLNDLRGRAVAVLELVFSWHVCRKYATFLEYICEAFESLVPSYLPFHTLFITIQPSYHLSHPLSLCGPSDLLLQTHLPTLLAHHPQLDRIEFRYINSVDWQGTVEEVEVLHIGVEYIKDRGELGGWRVEKRRIGDGGHAAGPIADCRIGVNEDGERVVMMGVDGVERIEYELGLKPRDEDWSKAIPASYGSEIAGIRVLDVD